MSNEKADQKKIDPFIWEEVYPEPEAVFSFKNQTVEEIFPNADIVLDTNVLLLPFGTDIQSISEYERIYSKLIHENRLFVPAQAVREFAKNRHDKVGNLYHQINSKKQHGVKRSAYPLLIDSAEYKEIEAQENILLQQLDEYSKRITRMLQVIEKWGSNDPVSEMYRRVDLSARIIKSDIDRPQLLKDKERRFEHSIPPGYKDRGKEDGGIGDLLIWREILALGSANKRDLIFVTGEIKPDWWTQSSGSPLHVRYELIDEYRRCSSGKSFQIISLRQLLQLCDADVKSIDLATAAQLEVKDEEDEGDLSEESKPTSLDFPSFERIAESSVRAWVKNTLGSCMSHISTGGAVDFTAHGQDGTIGYEVKGIRHVQYIDRRISEALTLGRKFVANSSEFDTEFRVVFVAESLAGALKGADIAKSSSCPSPFGVVIGYLNDDLAFCEVFRSYSDTKDQNVLNLFF